MSELAVSHYLSAFPTVESIKRMPLQVGDNLGPYEILASIGAGGMGEVYRARDGRLGRDVALKVLPEEVSTDPGRRQRFETEARAVAALNHPNIVSVYDVGLQDRTAYIVSELVRGETLRRTIARGPMPVRKVLDMAAQITDGLSAAHAVSIIHRDLKPENVMLTADGRVKILDFGLAKSICGMAAQTDATRTMALSQPGSIVGTVSYMSPEQASGRADLDGRSDQFSLGLIMHEMITGRKAFERPTAAAIIREDQPPLADSLRGPMRWTIERCLAKEPSQRFDATRDLFLALRQMVDHASELTGAAPAVTPAVARARRRWWWPAAVASSLAAGFLLAVLWLPGPLATARYIPFATEAGIQTMPAWSPAGDRIAYSGEVNGIFQIFMRKVGSSTPSQLTHQDASSYLPFWSPDSTRVYYILSPGPLDRSLWSSAVAGGEAEKILDRVTRAAISPRRKDAGRDGSATGRFHLRADDIVTARCASPAISAGSNRAAALHAHRRFCAEIFERRAQHRTSLHRRPVRIMGHPDRWRPGAKHHAWPGPARHLPGLGLVGRQEHPIFTVQRRRLARRALGFPGRIAPPDHIGSFTGKVRRPLSR